MKNKKQTLTVDVSSGQIKIEIRGNVRKITISLFALGFGIISLIAGLIEARPVLYDVIKSILALIAPLN